MSRLILFLGGILLVIGVIGFVAGMVIIPTTVVNTVSSAKNPDASKLCHPGESLATEEGPEEYDVSQQIYDRSVDFYCVTNEGVRRDVTDQVGQGVVNGIFGAFSTVIIPVASCFLGVIGFVMLLFGMIFAGRRAARAAVGNVMPGFSSAFTPATQPPAPSGGDLSLKLRQLDEARQSGLINEDEYQRKRQQLLDSMR